MSNDHRGVKGRHTFAVQFTAAHRSRAGILHTFDEFSTSSRAFGGQSISSISETTQVGFFYSTHSVKRLTTKHDRLNRDGFGEGRGRE